MTLPQVGLVKCKDCGTEKTRIKSELTKYGYFSYREESGLLWSGISCRACANTYQVELGRKYGHVERKNLTDHANYTAIKSEAIAKSYFVNMGYLVKQTQCHGPDLVLTMNKTSITCEVKTATQRKQQGNFWYVSPVSEKRKSDDLIAIVVPNKTVVVHPMKYHLSCCSVSGQRTVTEIVRLNYK